MVCPGRPPYVTGRAVRGASPEGETAQEAQPGGVGPDVDPDDSTAPELTGEQGHTSSVIELKIPRQIYDRTFGNQDHNVQYPERDPPRHPSEKDARGKFIKIKYNTSRSPNENFKIFKLNLIQPHSRSVLRSPTLTDYAWSSTAKCYTSFTDALHTALNATEEQQNRNSTYAQ